MNGEKNWVTGVKLGPEATERLEAMLLGLRRLAETPGLPASHAAVIAREIEKIEAVLHTGEGW